MQALRVVRDEAPDQVRGKRGCCALRGEAAPRPVLGEGVFGAGHRQVCEGLLGCDVARSALPMGEGWRRLGNA